MCTSEGKLDSASCPSYHHHPARGREGGREGRGAREEERERRREGERGERQRRRERREREREKREREREREAADYLVAATRHTPPAPAPCCIAARIRSGFPCIISATCENMFAGEGCDCPLLVELVAVVVVEVL